MSKEEWIEVLDSAYEKALRDYQLVGRRTPEEYMARLCMSIFDYLSSAIKESNEG
jgi:hypothetical protein